jgi:DNA-binding PadR family transcriptional regulator
VPGRPAEPLDALPLKTDVLFVLLAVAQQPLHGYGILRDVEVRSSGEVMLQTGALYRTLRRMLEDDLIVECPRPADVRSDDERRRYYTVTGHGRAVLDAEVARLSRLLRAARLSSAGKRPRLT